MSRRETVKRPRVLAPGASYGKVRAPVAVRGSLTAPSAFCRVGRRCETSRYPVIITRNREQSVVLLSLEDYQALEETAFPLRTPADAARQESTILGHR